MNFGKKIQVNEPLASNGMSRLVDIETGVQVRIDSFTGKSSTMKKLNQFGLYPGDLAHIVRRAPFGGPVLLQVRGMELALGRSLAECILVEIVACVSH